MPERETDGLFLQLLVVFEAQAMVQLGKVVNPASQEVNRDLDAAKGTISMIEMLERKTRGNLTTEEEGLVKRVLTGLRMNYLDELSKEKARETKAREAEKKPNVEEREDSEEQPTPRATDSGTGSAETSAQGEAAAAGDLHDEHPAP